jgi:tRNA A37 threonylcarbamoyladenosine synthetase subunit TsaC/SUA5/YrdC
MNKDLIYLVQTDTTVGFSSASAEKLSDVKQRPQGKKILHTVDSFKTLKKYTRIPKKHKKLVRNSNKTTFIYPNLKSFRVVNDNSNFYRFLNKFNILYSTSANLTGKNFQKNFALQNAQVIVEDKQGFSQKVSSSIFLLKKYRKKQIR